MKKLVLRKETIRTLDNRELNNVQGGNDDTVHLCFTILATCQPVTIEPCQTIVTENCPSLNHCKTWKC